MTCQADGSFDQTASCVPIPVPNVPNTDGTAGSGAGENTDGGQNDCELEIRNDCIRLSTEKVDANGIKTACPPNFSPAFIPSTRMAHDIYSRFVLSPSLRLISHPDFPCPANTFYSILVSGGEPY